MRARVLRALVATSIVAATAPAGGRCRAMDLALTTGPSVATGLASAGRLLPATGAAFAVGLPSAATLVFAGALASAEGSPPVADTAPLDAAPELRTETRVWPEVPGKMVSEVQVALLLEIDATGTVTAAESAFCNHPDAGFEEAAEQAVLQWHFEPARRAGEAVPTAWGAVVLFLWDEAGQVGFAQVVGPPWEVLLDAGERELASGRPGAASEALDRALSLLSPDTTGRPGDTTVPGAAIAAAATGNPQGAPGPSEDSTETTDSATPATAATDTPRETPARPGDERPPVEATTPPSTSRGDGTSDEPAATPPPEAAAAGGARPDPSATARGRVLSARGRANLLRGRVAEGEADLVRALELLRDAAPTGEELEALSALAMLRVRQERPSDARPLLERWVERVQQQDPPDPAEVVASQGALGRLYLQLGELELAEPLLQRVVEVAPEVDPSGFTSGLALESLILLHLRDGDTGAAGELVESYLERVRKLGDPLTLLESRKRIAAAFREAGDTERSARIWRDAEAELEASGPEHAARVGKLLDLGAAAAQAGDLEAAEGLFRRALRIAGEKTPRDLVELAETEFALGHLLVQMGNLGRGEEHLQEAREYFALVEPNDSPRHVTTMMELGMLRASLGDVDAACGHFLDAVEISRRQTGSSTELVSPLMSLAACEAERGNLEEAEARSGEALALLDRAPGAPAEVLIELLKQRVAVLRALGREADAAAAERRLRSLISRTPRG
jgi:TonB family protein